MNEEDLTVEDDILTSFNYYFNNYHATYNSPEQDLAKAVLVFGLIDFLSANRKEFYLDARKWFFTDDENDNYMYTFNNVCGLMEINPDRFRERLKKLKKLKGIKFALDGKRIAS